MLSTDPDVSIQKMHTSASGACTCRSSHRDRQNESAVGTGTFQERREHEHSLSPFLHHEPIGSDKPRSLLVLLFLTGSNNQLVRSKHASVSNVPITPS